MGMPTEWGTFYVRSSEGKARAIIRVGGDEKRRCVADACVWAEATLRDIALPVKNHTIRRQALCSSRRPRSDSTHPYPTNQPFGDDDDDLESGFVLRRVNWTGLCYHVTIDGPGGCFDVNVHQQGRKCRASRYNRTVN